MYQILVILAQDIILVNKISILKYLMKYISYKPKLTLNTIFQDYIMLYKTNKILYDI